MPPKDLLQLVLIPRGRLPRGRRVPQVQHGRGKSTTLDPDARVHQPDDQVGILRSPADVGLVQAVDPQEILPGHSQIEGPQRSPVPGAPTPPATVGQGPEQRQDPIGVPPCPGDHPTAGRPAMNGQVVRKHVGGQSLGQEDAAPADHHALAGQQSMTGDEAWSRDAVPVDQDDVVSGGRGDRPVADGRRPESLISVPDVFQRNRKGGRESTDQIGGLAGGSIVRNEDLEAAIRGGASLVRQSTQRRGQGVGPVVGRHDDGEAQRHGGLEQYRTVAMTTLDPQTLIAAYSEGYFPMANPENGDLEWYNPDPRCILPLEGLRISASLARRVRSGRFRVVTDSAFESVIRACGAGRGHPEDTWIDERFVRAYGDLHARGLAHSVEAWRDGRLVGGLYGVRLGGVFMGESMFSSPQRGGTDSSKVCLVWLVHHLKRIGVEILDVQFSTDHLARLGAIEIPRRRYLADLARCRHHRTRWQGWPEELIVRATPGSGPS